MKRNIITQKIVLLFILFLPLSFTFGQEVNAVCPDAWQNEKNAVVRIKSGKGQFWTGTLINTTLGDNNPHHYVLTHGFSKTSGSNDLSDWEFYWHYESPWCYYDGMPNAITTTGARVVAKNTCSTFVLIELDVDPAEQWDITPYYMGWDRSDEIVTDLTLIYHPLGSIKKIQHSNSAIEKESVSGCYVNGIVDVYPEWSTGYWAWVSQPGSGADGVGGSPLLNSDHKLIGYYLWDDCLGGGCTDIKRYGNFSWAWEGWNKPDSTARLKEWLDPLNTGQVTLEGRGCQKTIRLSQPPISLQRPMVYHAVENIISKQEIDNNRTVTYKAGTEIVLMCENRGTGFHAKPGSNFHAYIEELDCNGSKAISHSPQGDGNSTDNMRGSTSKSSQLQATHEISLFPNPNTGSFQMETNFPLSDIGNLKITNIMGVPVYETQNVTSNTIQLQNAASGQYFVVMILKDGSVLTQKMMVQR